MNSAEIPSSPLTPEERLEIAKLVLPDFDSLPSLDQIESRYPKRSLAEGALVTRVAPSPTGFAHIGFVYMSLVNRLLAHQSSGTFILRIEDTDSNREVEGAFETIINTLHTFGLDPDEGVVKGKDGNISEIGNYKPYVQSERKEIYRAVVKHLLLNGRAYPCFCTSEELEGMAEQQRLTRQRTGYHGQWAKWRDAPISIVKKELEKNPTPTIRLRSFGSHDERTTWEDGTRGRLALPQNDMDIVILKSDGQSLYHLAHAVDDHFMRINQVVRGDEWVSSVPLHIQIFQLLSWEPPRYAHLSTIQTSELVSETDEKTGQVVEKRIKRKLSKRKDPEANAQYYLKSGFPIPAVLEYLINIANSSFEDWRKANLHSPMSEFKLRLDKFSASGALADTVKLTDISKDVISRMSAEQILESAMPWLEANDTELYNLINQNKELCLKALSIERGGKKPNRRIAIWPDLRKELTWCLEPLFNKIQNFDFDPAIKDRSAIVDAYLKVFDLADSREAWFEKCKTVASQLGFAPEVKLFKANPENYKGHVGDITMVLRVAICGARQSSDLYDVMQTLGKEEVIKRLKKH